MIRGLVIVMAGLGLARAAFAETVLVRTAEHNGFTRIVIDYKTRPAWELGRDGDAYELRTTAEDVDYDLTGIYRRIYSGRLIAIEASGPGDLRLTTGCDCTLSTAPRANGGLIIDISDREGPAQNRYETALTAPAPAARPAPETPEPRPVPPVSIDLPMGSNLTAPSVLPVLPDDDIRRAAAELGANLAEEIGRAAELDLVDLSPGVTAESLAKADAPSSAAAPHRDPGAQDDVGQSPKGPNLRIVTEAERAMSERGSPGSVDPSLCSRLEKVLDPNKWVQKGSGPAGVQFDRKELIDIRGQADARGFRNLIRGYLYLTFGREALAALDMAPDEMVYKSLYAALANIVEERPAGNNALAGMTTCPGHTGLWARLAEPDAVAYKGDTTRPAAFAEWPVHLRRALGPRLSEAYLDAGDDETARTIFRAIARVSAPNDPAFLLLAARMAEPGRRATAQTEALTEIAQTRTPESARAVIGVIDARIREGVTVGADLAMQAGALAFELSETEGAAVLREAEIRALVHDGLWKAAVARLEAHDPLPERGTLVSSLVEAAAERASDADLLWIAARMEGEHDITRPARVKMAARIAKLGVAEMARTALDLGAAIPTAPERRVLAEIALLEDHPSIAEAYLAGLDTAEDAALMARVETMRARQKAAADAGYVPPTKPDMAAAGQIMESPSETLSGRAEPVEVARNAPQLPAVPESGLQASRSLLGDSASLRNELEALLGPQTTR